MIIKYDVYYEPLLNKLLSDPNLIIGLDATRVDGYINVTYCIRNGFEIIKIDTIKFKEAK